jgi:polyhydroxyalkanoate synthesis regulator phasin
MIFITHCVILKEPSMSEDTTREKIRGTIYDATRTILLAAIGAASLAQDEMNSFVDRLVERGELAEVDARKIVREMIDRREKMELERKARVRKHTRPAAAQADIEALTARVAELTRQIEELKKDQAV